MSVYQLSLMPFHEQIKVAQQLVYEVQIATANAVYSNIEDLLWVRCQKLGLPHWYPEKRAPLELDIAECHIKWSVITPGDSHHIRDALSRLNCIRYRLEEIAPGTYRSDLYKRAANLCFKVDEFAKAHSWVQLFKPSGVDNVHDLGVHYRALATV